MRRIKVNNVQDVSASSETTGFGADNLLDEHPSRLWKAAGLTSCVLEAEIKGGFSDLFFFGGTLADVDVTAYDPMFLEFGFDVDEWGGAESGTTSAIDKIVASSANVVDVFVYDTTKDSDGGDWCTGALAQASSWYNETLNTATRGATRPFPALALIVAETNKVTIYDATQATVPMWMVFIGKGSAMIYYTGAPSALITSVSIKNGLMAVTNGVYDIWLPDFLRDTGFRYTTGGKSQYNGNMLQRNINLTGQGALSGAGIVNRACNDCAMTVLPDAPIDSTTGLPVPTIAVATEGGVSVIDGPAGVGTVVDLTHTIINNNSGHVVFPENGGVSWSSRLTTNYI